MYLGGFVLEKSWIFFREHRSTWTIASLHRGVCGSTSYTPKEVWDFEVRLCGGTQVIKTPWGAGF